MTEEVDWLNLSRDDIVELRDRTHISMWEIHKRIKAQQLKQMVDYATTVDELKPIITALIDVIYPKPK
jgi:hypothetical protein